jgi:hypothetical protein
MNGIAAPGLATHSTAGLYDRRHGEEIGSLGRTGARTGRGRGED